MNNKMQINLEGPELLKCPLCRSEVNSKTYVQALNELRNKVEKSHNLELQKQKSEHENTIRQINESHNVQLNNLKDFYAAQNLTLKTELINANNKQIVELKQSYSDSIERQKEQFELASKDLEKSFSNELERKKNELHEAKELQQEMRSLGLQEGKKFANQDMEVLRKEILQKDIQLKRLSTDLEKLKNETNKTQAELIGEAGEINLCSLLENEFRDDKFVRQKRGSSAGDIVQHIKTSSGMVDTPIVFDNKESQSITKADIDKAKRYKTIHNTNYVLIVSKNLPKKECGEGVIGEKEGILLVHPSIVLELTRQIRKFLIDISKEKISHQDRTSKEARMFTFVSSQYTARKLNSLCEIYNKMNDLQAKEQRDHQSLWKTKNNLMEELRQTYVEITGGIDSIVHGGSLKSKTPEG